MKITCVATTSTHEIRFFEFTRPDGRTITSFFQVVTKPDLGIGCFDFYEDAIKLFNNPPLRKAEDKINTGRFHALQLVRC